MLLGARRSSPRSRPRPVRRIRAADGLAGQLLVAEPELDDPNFDHTVVLMLRA